MTPWGFRVIVSITNLEFRSPPQAIINSTVTPNMTFTKTSQKFGQWADSRANTVYGLGFASEQHLTQVGLQGYMAGAGLGLGLLLGTLGPLGRCCRMGLGIRPPFLVPWSMSQLWRPPTPVWDTPCPSLGAWDGLGVPSHAPALPSSLPPSTLCCLQTSILSHPIVSPGWVVLSDS